MHYGAGPFESAEFSYCELYLRQIQFCGSMMVDRERVLFLSFGTTEVL